MATFHLLRFASDWQLLGAVSAALLSVSALAGWRDARRKRRENLDAVGIVPWRDLAALSAFAGFLLLVIAVAAWLKAS